MTRPETDFPHLWRGVWRSALSLQIGVFSTAWPRVETVPLAPRFDGGIVGASDLRAEDERDPWSTPSSRRPKACGTDVAARLRGALNETTFGNWFSEVDPVSVDDDAFVLAVPNDFTREWIEGHFVELIRAAMKDATGAERRLRLTVQAQPPAPPVPADARLGRRRGERRRRRSRGPTAASSRSTRSTRS